jgi:type II secretory pathway pseudopilin PulG
VIVAVLAGILFPVFARAKRAAKVETGKQYLRQQFLLLETYAIDSQDVYPGYADVMSDKKIQAPCAPLYDWNTPCWATRKESLPWNPLSDAPSPMLGGRGYIYAIRNWQDIDKLGADTFLGWDRNKAYPILCDVFQGNYRLQELEGAVPDLNKCRKLETDEAGCRWPDVVWYAYTDGSLRKRKGSVAVTIGQAYRLFDWLDVFLRQMDSDTKNGN